MIHRERVIGMPLQYLVELLNGAVVIEIVEMVEGRVIQGVVGTERQGILWVVYLSVRLGSCYRERTRQKQQGQKQVATGQGAGRQIWPFLCSVLGSVLCLSLSDAGALEAMEPRTS